MIDACMPSTAIEKLHIQHRVNCFSCLSLNDYTMLFSCNGWRINKQKECRRCVCVWTMCLRILINSSYCRHRRHKAHSYKPIRNYSTPSTLVHISNAFSNLQFIISLSHTHRMNKIELMAGKKSTKNDIILNCRTDREREEKKEREKNQLKYLITTLLNHVTCLKFGFVQAGFLLAHTHTVHICHYFWFGIHIFVTFPFTFSFVQFALNFTKNLFVSFIFFLTVFFLCRIRFSILFEGKLKHVKILHTHTWQFVQI